MWYLLSSKQCRQLESTLEDVANTCSAYLEDLDLPSSLLYVAVKDHRYDYERIFSKKGQSNGYLFLSFIGKYSNISSSTIVRWL